MVGAEKNWCHRADEPLFVHLLTVRNAKEKCLKNLFNRRCGCDLLESTVVRCVKVNQRETFVGPLFETQPFQKTCWRLSLTNTPRVSIL